MGNIDNEANKINKISFIAMWNKYYKVLVFMYLNNIIHAFDSTMEFSDIPRKLFVEKTFLELLI